MKKAIIITLCVIFGAVIIVGAILGGVFGYAADSANRAAKYGQDECVRAAIAFADVKYGIKIGGTFEVVGNSVHRDFRYNGRKPGDSYYTYEIELRSITKDGRSVEIELEVDTRDLTNIFLIDFDD